MSIGVIIQARMGSTRLPGKVLRDIGALPLLGHVLGRLSMSRQTMTAVVATTLLSQDESIAEYCKHVGAHCYRGDEQDVLDRYYHCAKQYGFKHVVRLTADNPFTDIEELDRLIDKHLSEINDFTHAFGVLPIGVGAEIFTFDALHQSWMHGHAPHHREHVDEYLLENPQIFKTGTLTIPAEKASPTLRLTVDTDDDWRRADNLVKASQGEWLTTKRIIDLCSASA